jgi:hypothetical protein
MRESRIGPAGNPRPITEFAERMVHREHTGVEVSRRGSSERGMPPTDTREALGRTQMKKLSKHKSSKRLLNGPPNMFASLTLNRGSVIEPTVNLQARGGGAGIDISGRIER